MNFKDFPRHSIDWILSILVCFCVLFLCFFSVNEYPFEYEVLDFRRVFNAIKVSGFITLYLVISFVLFNKRVKEVIPGLVRYFLYIFYIILIVYSCNHINYR